MKLKISYKGKNYLAEVEKEKFFYCIKLQRYNDEYTWKEPHGFQIYSCSIQCRLKHYKEFKNRIFDNKIAFKKFKEI